MAYRKIYRAGLIGPKARIARVQKETGDTCGAKFPPVMLRRQRTWLGAILPEVKA